MAALTKDIARRRLGPALRRGAAGLAANTIVFKGSAISSVSGTNGVIPTATATTHIVRGVVTDLVDGTNGAASGQAAQAVRVEYESGVFEFDILGADPVTSAQEGLDVYAVDDNTIAATNGGSTRSVMGKLVRVEAGKAHVLVGDGLKS